MQTFQKSNIIIPKPELDGQVTKQFLNVINAQARLIDKLLQNQKHLLQSIRSLPGHDNQDLQSYMINNSKLDQNQYQMRNIYKIASNRESSINRQNIGKPEYKKIKIQSNKLQRQIFESQEIESQKSQPSDYHQELKSFKIPQTKNVIKNFSKSLFRFIQKHRVYVRKVLHNLNIKEQEFHKSFQKFKGKIYTISELRQLWLPQGNYCHKAFRIISLQYLRKFNLEHVFNSRVTNYKTHIKYRRKMYEILQNPSEFTSIKLD